MHSAGVRMQKKKKSRHYIASSANIIVSTILCMWLLLYVENNWDKPVWISGKSIMDQIQALIQIIGKTCEYSVSVFHLFL
jgi:hypothetical protein